MAALNENINLRFTQRQWDKYTRKDWSDKIRKLRIGPTSEAHKRVTSKIIGDKEGNLTRFQYVFPFYLKFVEWGVGRGIDIGAVGLVRQARRLEGKRTGNRRRPKRWFRKPFVFNVARLNEIMAHKYSKKAVFTVVNTLEKE